MIPWRQGRQLLAGRLSQARYRNVQERAGTESRGQKPRGTGGKAKGARRQLLGCAYSAELLDVARGRFSRFPERPTGRQSLVRWDGFDICGCGTSRAGKWEAQVGVWGDVDPGALCG